MLTIFEAVRQNNIAILSNMIDEAKIDINVRDNDGDTLISIACSFSTVDTLKFLYDKGARWQMLPNKITPLYQIVFIHRANQRDKHEKLIYMLSLGFNFDDDDFKNICTGNCKEIRKKYANDIPLKKDRWSCNLLHYAAAWGDEDTVRWLLESPKKFNQRDEFGHYPIYYAASQGHLAIVKILFEKPGLVNQDDIIKDVLFIASATGGVDILRYFIDEKKAVQSLPKLIDSEGQTLIHIAAFHGQLKVVEYYLKEKCISLDETVMPYGWTPLHSATQSGHLPVVKFLLEGKYYPLNVENLVMGTPLHTAAKYNRLEIMQCILNEIQRSVTYVDSTGNTSLHIACRYGHNDVVGVLLTNALTSSTRNHKGNLPANEAANNGHLASLLEFIKQKEIDPVKECYLLDRATLIIPENSNFYFQLLTLWPEAIVNKANFFKEKFSGKKIQLHDCTFFSNRNSIVTLQALEILVTNDIVAGIKTLHLENITIPQKDIGLLVRILNCCVESLTRLGLKNCHITSGDMIKPVEALVRCRKLQYIDLSNNRLTFKFLYDLLLPEITSAGIPVTALNLSYNNITLCLEDRYLDPLIKQLEKLPRKSHFSLDITGNMFASDKMSKEIKSLFREFLFAHNWTLSQFLQAKLQSIRVDSTGVYLQLLMNDKRYETNISQLRNDLNGCKEKYHLQNHEQVFQLMHESLKNALLINYELSDKIFKDLTNQEQKLIAKRLLAYHPEATLKYQVFLKSSFFVSNKITKIASIWMPHIEITTQKWQAYLIVKKEGDSKDHTLLAIEGLKKYGQRYAFVAHLQVKLPKIEPAKQSIFDKSNCKEKSRIKIKSYPWEKIKLEEYYCINYECDKDRVIRLIDIINQEIKNGIPNTNYTSWQFRKIISFKNASDEQKERNRQVNCYDWAADHFANTLNIREPRAEKDNFPINIPTNIIQSLINKREGRMISQSAFKLSLKNGD